MLCQERSRVDERLEFVFKRKTHLTAGPRKPGAP